MSPSALALVGYVAWMLLLAITILSFRTALVLAKKRAANSFSPSGEEVSPFANRLCRAHANCYENLPIFAALILLALVTDNAGITDSLERISRYRRLHERAFHKSHGVLVQIKAASSTVV